MTHKRKCDQRLDDLYKTLPTIECQGLCHVSCGPIELTQDESRRIKDISGDNPTTDENLVCSKLVNNRCSVYEVRPAICRMFGVCIGMECPFGCQPSRYLSREEGMQFLQKVNKATGKKPMIKTSPELSQLLQDLFG